MINDPSLEKFDISFTYEHQENPNHLEISLCQERDSSANSINPKIFDAELLHHQNSHPMTVNFLKVTQISYKAVVQFNCGRSLSSYITILAFILVPKLF